MKETFPERLASDYEGRIYTGMKKRIILFVVTSAFSTSLLFAQGTPPTPPTPAQMVQRQVTHLTQLLQLSAPQQAAALTIFTNAITANEAQQAGLKTTRQALQTAIEATPPCGTSTPACTPPASISSATEIALGDIAKIGIAVASNNAVAATQFYGILTAAQQTAYNASRNRGPGGFGGPGGMGPQGFHGGPR